MIRVSHEEVYGIDIQKDIFGAKGDDLIIPFEKKLLKKKLVDQSDLQIWTKDMAERECMLFALVVAIGEQKYYVQSNGMGMYSRAQVDAMVASARTLAAR